MSIQCYMSTHIWQAQINNGNFVITATGKVFVGLFKQLLDLKNKAKGKKAKSF